MYTHITESEFVNKMQNIRPENFSVDGLRALFEYLEEMEDSIGEPLEFDPIAICCEYSEYENLAEFQGDHGEEYETIEDVQDETMVIEVDDERFIIQDF